MTLFVKSLALAGLLGAFAAPAIAADTFPVTITHALGTTTIPAKPERVVTLGWSAQDVVLDLGVMPVGMPFFNYGGGADGVLPWTEAAIKARGAEMPVVLPDGSALPIEAIAALHPDVIIAPYSGLTEAEYAQLGNIAPVIAYPETPWFAEWQAVVAMTGAALGESERATALVTDTEKFMQDAVAFYPELQGLVFANVVNRKDGQVAVRMGKDPRVKLLADLGMVPAPQVEGTALVPTGISYTLSYENFDRIEAQLLVSFFDDAASADAFFALPYIKLAPLVQKGAYAKLVGEELTMAVSGAVTPLSLRWGFPQVATAIGEAGRIARR